MTSSFNNDLFTQEDFDSDVYEPSSHAGGPSQQQLAAAQKMQQQRTLQRGMPQQKSPQKRLNKNKTKTTTKQTQNENENVTLIRIAQRKRCKYKKTIFFDQRILKRKNL